MEISKKTIMDAWVFLREKNHSIPDATLDFMRDAALKALATGTVAPKVGDSVNDNYMVLWDNGYHRYKKEFTNVGDLKEFIKNKKQSAYFNDYQVYKQIATTLI
jgi:hypothetical protein